MPIVIDSVVFIDAVIGEGPFYLAVAPLIREAEAGNLLWIVSEVTVTEACWLSREGAQKVSALEDVERYLANEWIRRVPVTPPISMAAAKVVRACNLETCDAIIAATAIMTEGVKTLYTRDMESMCKRLRRPVPSPSRPHRSPRPRLH